MGIRVGIDLGTTFCAVAKIDTDTGKPVVIKNSFGSTTTPSVLYFERDGSVLFGEDAKNMQSLGDTNAVAFFKRSMGKDMFSVDIHGRTYTATDLSAILLQKLKEEAEQQTGEKIDAAVITVPAYFTHKERSATITASKKAGIDVIAIINEPTSAAFAYGLTEKDQPQTVLIYDLGGGTFDATIADINKAEISILGSDGDHELGGKDWDDCIARYLANEFYERTGADPSDSPEMVASLLVTAENVKKQLTAKDIVNVPISYNNLRETIDITIETFEDISQHLIGTTKDVTNRLLASVGKSWSHIDGVILVGGSTRMRMIHKFVYEMSGKHPLGGVNVDEAVALGAAIRANITEKGEPVPAISGLLGQKRSNELLIQGAKAVTDVTAHSLGMISVSSDGNSYVNSIIINKNTKIPARITRAFTLRTRARDNELEVYVLQGEHPRPMDNTLINKYVVTNIEHARTSKSVINVTYEYNANGVIEVSAIQQETQKQLPINIEPITQDMSWTDLSPAAHLPQTIDIILAVDLSGSMCGDPIQEAMRAMQNFLSQMDSRTTRVGIVAFARTAKTVLSPTSDFAVVARAISKLAKVNVGMSTDAEPFSLAYRELTAKNSSATRYIVVLTDGCWGNSNYAISIANKCHNDNIDVIALGFGDADYSFLRQIASTEEFASITDLSSLGGSFSKIAQAIGDFSSFDKTR